MHLVVNVERRRDVEVLPAVKMAWTQNIECDAMEGTMNRAFIGTAAALRLVGLERRGLRTYRYIV